MWVQNKKVISVVFLGVIPLTAACSARDGPGEGEAMAGFSWVLDEQLAGMPRPGATRPLEDDLDFLVTQRIELLVSLTETPPNPDLVASRGIRLHHSPVEDFAAPTQAQLGEFVELANAVIEAGGRVGVHCAAGKGRTGTFLAVFLVSQGMTAEEAIAEVRRLRPGSVETEEQEQAVAEYYDMLVGGTEEQL